MPRFSVMPKETTEIEVEVVEVDGLAPVAPQARAEPQASRPAGDWPDWRQWQGRVTRLDSRWWPLWVLLGLIALVVFLTFGIVIAAVYLVLRLIGKFIRAITR